MPCDSHLGSGRDCCVFVGKLTTSVSSATEKLFNACRLEQVGNNKVEYVQKQFHDEHWDFGVRSGVPRTLRTTSVKKLKCHYGLRTFTLEELDKHVLTGTRIYITTIIHHILFTESSNS